MKARPDCTILMLVIFNVFTAFPLLSMNEQKSTTIIPIACCLDYSLFISDKNKLFICGSIAPYSNDLYVIPTIIHQVSNENFIQVGATYNDIIAVSSKGEIYETKSSKYMFNNRLNLERNLFFKEYSINTITCGVDFALILSNDDKIYFKGKLHLGNRYRGKYKEILIQSLDWKQMKNPSKFSIKSIAAGNNTVFLINEKGRTFSFGTNLNGKIGHPQSIPYLKKPKKIEALREKSIVKILNNRCQIIAIDNEGQAYALGMFQIRKDKSIEDYDTRAAVSILKKLYVVDIVGNEDCLIIKSKNRKIYKFQVETIRNTFSYPKEYNSRLFEQYKITMDSEILYMSATMSHLLMVDKNAQVYSEGKTSRGRLGLGDFDMLHDGIKYFEMLKNFKACTKLRWSPAAHRRFPEDIRMIIKIMLYKYARKQAKLRVPKPVLFIIFSHFTA